MAAMSCEPRSWAEPCAPVIVRRDIDQADEILAALEAGGLVRLEGCAFELEPAEAVFMDPRVSDGKSKNVSYDPARDRLGGSSLEGDERRRLAAMIARYAVWAESLVRRLLPAYGARLEPARTSFRPRPIGGEALSPRKDDRRLHVDAFPSQPVQGRRILRVFSNVDPGGEARVWTLGEGFEAYARRFLPASAAGAPVRDWLEARLGLTRGRRTAYDRMMLALHDRAKADDAYQANAPRRRIEFAPGDTWLVFTDAAPHAALTGKNAFEQTFLLPVESLSDQAASPLRTLERLSGRALV
jgi:hypothetical protein